MASAMGRSKCAPDLGRLAGAMDTMIFVFGHGSVLLDTAVRIRERASLIPVSAIPTI